MNVTQFKPIAILLLVVGFASCEEDNPTDALQGKHKILLSTNVGTSSYYGTIKDLSVGTMTNDNSYEHVDKAASFVYKDMVFISEHWNGDVLHKYIRTEDGIMQVAGTVTLPAGGNAQSMTFLDENKAYIGLNTHGSIYIINPTTLEHLGDIDLTSYAVGDNNPDPADMIIRDNKLFIALNQNITMYSLHDSAYVAIINTSDESIDKVILDTRMTGVSSSYNHAVFMDENKDIYFYSQGAWGYQPGANDGFLRIKNGETEFDPDYYFSPKNTTVNGVDGGVLYGMTLCYAGNGKVYTTMMAPALTSDPPDYENDKNSVPVVLDIYNKTIQKLDLPNTSMYASVGVVKLDDKILFGMSCNSGDGIYTYDLLSGEGSQIPVVTTVGKPQFMNVFEN